jgi:hypothetical protein
MFSACGQLGMSRSVIAENISTDTSGKKRL